jgi:hypothetical protein
MAKLSDLIPDNRNANKGTERGQHMIEESLRSYGAGRSILLDKNMRIIAGNKTAENFGSIGMEDVIVVQTDGTKLVAVQRMDLDLDEPRAMELAIADNRAGQVSLDWDADVLAAMAEEIDLSKFWSPDELESLIASGNAASNKAAGNATLAERFGVPPFSVLDARQGYWQDRKRAWLSLGIQSEVGRGGASSTPPHCPTVTQNSDGTLNYNGTAGQSKRFDRQRREAAPGGSARPACDYSQKQRGDGRGMALVTRTGA